MLILFDVGGTNTRIAVSHDGTALDHTKIVPTSPLYADGLKHLQTLAEELAAGGTITAVSGVLAGSFDRNHDALLNGENISDWVGKPIRADLERMFGVPVTLENDAGAACLGEALYGAGKGHEIVAYLTVSTGIGGSRVVGGRIDASAIGFEPGNQVIDAGRGFIPGWPVHRLMDVSGKALEKIFQKHPAEIVDAGVWERVADVLAIGVNNTIVYWSPDIIVIGGSVMASIPLDYVEERVRDIRRGFPKSPPLARAALGDTAGLWGALARVRQT
ncbi:MAG: ROK family protein [Patescibacteria group bacterium]